MSMKFSELEGKDRNALTKELHELLKERFNLRMLVATQQLNTTHKLNQVRKNIARVLTMMNKKAD